MEFLVILMFLSIGLTVKVPMVFWVMLFGYTFLWGCSIIIDIDEDDDDE